MTTSTENVVNSQRQWSRPTPMTLTYYVVPTEKAVNNLSSKDIKSTFSRAFARWSEIIPMSFREIDQFKKQQKPDITIGFCPGDGYPFVQKPDTMAMAMKQSIYVNTHVIWTVDFEKEKSEIAYDLESAVMHEIGHVLGLDHSEDKKSIMYPTGFPRKKIVDFTVEDVKRAQELYGSNPKFGKNPSRRRRWFLKLKKFFTNSS